MSGSDAANPLRLQFFQGFNTPLEVGDTCVVQILHLIKCFNEVSFGLSHRTKPFVFDLFVDDVFGPLPEIFLLLATPTLVVQPDKPACDCDDQDTQQIPIIAPCPAQLQSVE
jgi:hypothetical protein